MKGIKFYLLSALLIVLFTLTVSGQPNSYFQNNENWAGKYFGADYHTDYYIKQAGDTIIGQDTLIQLIYEGAYFAPGNFITFVGDPTTPLFWAKDSGQVVTVYKYNPSLSVTSDTGIIDYSRIDSITYTKLGTIDEYMAMAILSIDTFYYNGVAKKRFNINNECSGTQDDFAYEGILGPLGYPFFDGCFEYGHILTCFSAFDSTYNSYWDSLSIPYYGNCIINNLNTANIPDTKLQIFPNPTTSAIYLKDLDNFQGAYIVVYNAVGQIKYETIYTGSTFELDVSTWKDGMYHIHIFTNGNPVGHSHFIKI